MLVLTFNRNIMTKHEKYAISIELHNNS